MPSDGRRANRARSATSQAATTAAVVAVGSGASRLGIAMTLAALPLGKIGRTASAAPRCSKWVSTCSNTGVATSAAVVANAARTAGRWAGVARRSR